MSDETTSSASDTAIVDETPVVIETTSSSAAPAPPAENADEQYLLPPMPENMSRQDWMNCLANNHTAMHDYIDNFAPIDGISGGAQDIRAYEIMFKPEATPEQRAAAQEALLRWPVVLKNRKAREEALTEVQSWFDEQIATGFIVPSKNGMKLGLTNADITLLTGNYIMAQQAATLGLPLPPVVDVYGVAYFFATIDELTQVMLAYGQHRANLTMHYAARKAEVDAQFPEEAAPTV